MVYVSTTVMCTRYFWGQTENFQHTFKKKDKVVSLKTYVFTHSVHGKVWNSSYFLFLAQWKSAGYQLLP